MKKKRADEVKKKIKEHLRGDVKTFKEEIKDDKKMMRSLNGKKPGCKR